MIKYRAIVANGYEEHLDISFLQQKYPNHRIDRIEDDIATIEQEHTAETLMKLQPNDTD